MESQTLLENLQKYGGKYIEVLTLEKHILLKKNILLINIKKYIGIFYLFIKFRE